MKVPEFKPSSINILPMLSCAVAALLGASKRQLSWLNQAEKISKKVLDDEALSCIIDSYIKQNETIANEKILCAFWRKLNPTVEQSKLMDELEINLKDMEKINHQILFLATHYYKGHATDKIIGSTWL